MAFVAACVGPVIILPPPDAPEGVNVALEGTAVFCGHVAAGSANVVFVNNTNPASPDAIGDTDACGCYEDVVLLADPGDEVDLFYFTADQAVSERFTLMRADLGGGAPTSCTACAAQACP